MLNQTNHLYMLEGENCRFNTPQSQRRILRTLHIIVCLILHTKDFITINKIVYSKLRSSYDIKAKMHIKPLGLRIQPLLEQANISIKNVQPFSLPSKEPWTQNPQNIVLGLHKNKRVDSHIFKTELLEIKSTYTITSPFILTIQNKTKSCLCCY